MSVWKAGNDRVSGWQLMFRQLARGRWLIADTCPKLISAIPSRVYDPKKHFGAKACPKKDSQRAGLSCNN